MPTVDVQVTQKDINDGRRRDCYECPIARALKRVLRPGVYVAVKFSEFCLNTCSNNYKLPREACDFIDKFDDRLEVFPFKFTVDIPEEHLCLSSK